MTAAILRRTLLVCACIAAGITVAVVFTGRLTWPRDIVGASWRSPVPPLTVAALATGIYLALSRARTLRDDVASVVNTLERAAGAISVTLAIIVAAAGIRYGTFVAGGSDPYGYVSQAGLWVSGVLRVPQPWLKDWTWPDAAWTTAPLGYRPAPVPGAIVPTYPSGLPLLMAAATGIGGREAPFFVVPILGGLAIWITYLLGRRWFGPLVGLGSAFLMATSPSFLLQLMWPMSDVPALALWAGASSLVLIGTRRSLAAAGVVASLAVMTRPNLMPLSALTIGAIAVARVRTSVTSAVWDAGTYLALLAPGLAALGALNQYLYGSPFRFGYGALAELYAWAHLPENAQRYPVWLVKSQTPLILVCFAGLLGPAGADRGRRILWRLLAPGFITIVALSYLFYLPFDEWWYLRFWLPAFPFLLVAAAAGAAWLAQYIPQPARATLLLVLAIAVGARNVSFAGDNGAWAAQRGERRYKEVGTYVEQCVPQNAVILAMQHSGSLRYYSGRVTLRYDELPPDWLDRAVAILNEKGHATYLVLEAWEEARFMRRFETQRLGRLDWNPLANSRGPSRVAIYDTSPETAPRRPRRIAAAGEPQRCP